MRGKEFTEGSLHFYCVCLYLTQCVESEGHEARRTGSYGN